MSNNVFPPPPSYMSGRLEVPFVFDTPPPPLMAHHPPLVHSPLKGFLLGDVRGFRSGPNSGPSVVGTPNLIQVPYFTSPAQLKKETDDLARKQEEFILRCQYPKRILPSEMKSETSKRNYYSLRRRDRSPSPPGVEIHRRDRGKSSGGGGGGGRRGYRSYSKSPPDWGRRERRVGGQRTEDRSQSRSPPPPHYSHAHSPGGGNTPHPSPPSPLLSAPSTAHRSK